MRRIQAALIAILLVLVTAGSVAAATNHFRAHATGDQEVPTVMTLAQGQATFKLSDDGTALTYKLNVANLENVRFAHIHLAPKGVNGPVVAFLRRDRVDGPVNGRYAEGTITAADLLGPLAGKPLSDLIAAMEAGNAYINVHTDAHPGGEVRGQIQ